jgi:hypothetical protein
MNWRRGAEKTTTSDELTVHWREPLVYPVVVFEQDRDAPIRSLKHRMNRQVSSSSSNSHVKANRDVLAAGSSAPDESTVHWSIALEQLCQRSCTVEATPSSTEWTISQKDIASDHLTVLLWEAFSQQLVWCFGLFIPPPLAHLRLLSGIHPRYSCTEGRKVEDGLLLEFPCTPTRTRFV